MSAFFSHVRASVLFWLSLVLVLVPSPLKIPVYRHMYGYEIGKRVKIGLCWIWVGKLKIGDNVIIQHLTRLKSIPEVVIGDHTTIGAGNTFTSAAEFTHKDGITHRGNCPRLVIGSHVGISLFHYFDIQDTFEIGSFTTIAGINSVFFTHYIDVVTGLQSAKPIYIGKYCLISSSVRFTPGVRIADCSVVSMGSVVTRSFEEEYVLVGGNPASIVKQLPRNAAYFKRTVGWIGTYMAPPW